MKYFFKYNTESRGREGNGTTWMIHPIIDGNLETPLMTDHLEFEVPISTQEKQLGFGFGMCCEGKLVHDINDLDGSAYVRIVKEDANEIEETSGTIYSIKYHVPGRGLLGNDNVWRIYQSIDKGYTDTVYVEHIEIDEKTPSWTGEDLYNVGYSLIVRGQIEIFTNRESGRKHARIFKI